MCGLQKGVVRLFAIRGEYIWRFFAAYLRLGFFPLSESVNYEHKVLSGGN